MENLGKSWEIDEKFGNLGKWLVKFIGKLKKVCEVMARSTTIWMHYIQGPAAG